MITEQERRELLASTREMVAEVSRLAADIERKTTERERARLRGLAELFHAKHGRTVAAPIEFEDQDDANAHHVSRGRPCAIIIPFPKGGKRCLG